MDIKSQFSLHPDWPKALEVLDTLTQAGYQAFLVGGCVRDTLLGVEFKDFDVATNAQPEKVEALFPKTVNIGKEFGVIAVIFSDGFGIEVTTYRRELEYNDKRQPIRIEFTDLKGDASRRDFTINALYFNPYGDKLIDPFAGVEDLKSKRVRAIGDPNERLKEDPLRILRAVRFASKFNFDLDGALKKALVEEREKLKQVSRERIYDELRKMLGSQWKKALGLIHELKLWEPMGLIGPSEEKMKELSKANLPTALAVILAFLWDELSSEERKKNLVSLKPPNQVAKEVEFIVERSKTILQKKIRKAELFRIFSEAPEGFSDYLRFRGFSRLDSLRDDYEKVLDEDGRLPQPLVSGEELMARGIKKGPEIGALKNEIYFRQLEGSFSSLDDLDDLLNEIRRTSNEV